MRTRNTRVVTEILTSEGLLTAVRGELRTTKRWQGAMMRAAARLVREGVTGGDLRLPVALALVDIFKDDYPEDVILTMVAILTPIELLELEPQRRSEPQRVVEPVPPR